MPFKKVSKNEGYHMEVIRGIDDPYRGMDSSIKISLSYGKNAYKKA